MDKNTVITYKSEGGKIVFRWPAHGPFWWTKITGLQTDISLNTSQSAGQTGSTVNGQSVQSKKLTFNGAAYSATDVQLLRDKLLSTVLPFKQARLTFDLSGERWYLDGYPTSTATFGDGETVQQFQFQFFVPYPYFRSTKTKIYQLSGLQALWHTPFYTGGTFWISKYTEDAFKKVENSGSAEQAITLTLYAAAEVVNPIVYNVDRSTHIAINRTMSTGERFIISTHDSDKDAGKAVRFIAANGVESNGFRFLTPDSDLSMSVAPGGNIFMAEAEANKQNIRCTLVTAGGERHSI